MSYKDYCRKQFSLFLSFHCFLFLVSMVYCGKFKVADAPFSFNINQRASLHQPSGQHQEQTLMTRIDPEEPSGPPYLIKKLNGKCFVYMANSYKYELCPFQNVTQREQTYRWNAFQGVLGVWRHWVIENGTFVSMAMVHGDICMGTLDREVQVKLKCGEKNKIISVSEPETCRYIIIFKTPYACPTDVFRVYPMLSKDGKERIIQIEKDYVTRIITKRGYNKRLQKLYEDEKLYVQDHMEKKKSRTSDVKETVAANVNSSKESGAKPLNEIRREFFSKNHCIQEYELLYAEMVDLQEKLKSLENNRTNTIETWTNKTVSKYKRGELGDKSAILSNGGRFGKRLGYINESNGNPQAKSHAANKRKGDDGIVKEMENPERNLRDRLHENGVHLHDINGHAVSEK